MKNKEKGVSKGVKLRTIDEYMSANRVIYGEHKSSDSWSDGIVNSWYDDIIRRRKQPTKFEEMVDEHFWKTNAIACVLSWQYMYQGLPLPPDQALILADNINFWVDKFDELSNKAVDIILRNNKRKI